jgi:transposase
VKAGRPRIDIDDIVFAMVYKVYRDDPFDIFMPDLEDAFELEFVDTVPHFNTINNYFRDPALTPIFDRMILASCAPLRKVETRFAVDGTGVKTSTYTHFIDEETLTATRKRDSRQLLMICGVRTHIVPRAIVPDEQEAEIDYFTLLLGAAAKMFRILGVFADGVYLSRENYEALERIGAEGFIPFDGNSTYSPGCTLWKKMHYRYHHRKEEFYAKYHQRSNIEAAFSMLKADFEEWVRSKSIVAKRNEILCKILCHNIWVVIETSYELGIAPEFWPVRK